MKNDNSIPLASLFLILVFLAIFLVLILLGPGRGLTSLTCGPGQCSVNLSDGTKTCPDTSRESISFDPETQVCSARFSCTNGLAPYAVLPDGSTTDTGLCQGSDQCSCLSTPRCARYISSYFQAINASPYVPYYEGAVIYSQNLPDVPTTVNSFCSVSYDWLQRGQVYPKTCLSGNWAFVSNQDVVYSNVTPVSCVSAEPCLGQEIGVFNPDVQAMNCNARII